VLAETLPKLLDETQPLVGTKPVDVDGRYTHHPMIRALTEAARDCMPRTS
jgi:hypothetical protein